MFKRIKILAVLLFASTLIFPISAFAEEDTSNYIKDISYYSASQKLENLIKEDKVEKIDYYNPETGEYFAWLKSDYSTKSFTPAKNFSFYIRSYVCSEKFWIGSASIKVYSQARLVDVYGNEIYGARFPYEVNIISKLFDREKFQFETNGGQTEYGRVKGNRYYTVSISTGDNPDKYGDAPYLDGSGTVYQDI
ncbi:MAG: hypothetical protein E6312_00370 [Peptoniphilus grossensis]|uniref:hypothetical protein n=1 Tax=Peptoniphilus grossensis TaxID=1465756 RepID=UPI002912ABA8|nr:hypothetical protein [Peptoniphilus grossensis]MDU7150510.1 hypothetical protein [Peptoniphilus grossensis]